MHTGLPALACLAATYLGLTAFEAYTMSASSEPPAEVSHVDVAGVDSGDAAVDANNPDPRAPTEAAIEPAIAEARSLLGMVFDGQEQWLELAARLQDPRFVAPQRRACARHVSLTEAVCNLRLFTVIEPAGERSGRIVHARAELVDRPNESNAEGCDRYAECLATIRVSQDVPVPSDERDLFAVFQLIHAEPQRPEMLDANKVREVIEIFEAAAEELEKRPRSVDEELKLRSLAAQAEYLEGHARRLEQGQAVR